MLFTSLVHTVFVRAFPWVAGAYAWAGSCGLGQGSLQYCLTVLLGEDLESPPFFFSFYFLFSLLSKIPTCRSFPLPTLKEPGVPSKSWAPGPPTHHLCAMDGGSLAVLCKASIIPLHAETLLFHSSKHCQSKSQEGLFLALFSIVT